MSSVIIQQPADNKAYIKYFPSVEEQIATSESGISGQFVVKYDVDREMDAGDLMVGFILPEPRHDKTNNVVVRPAKTQISLGIRPV